MKKGEIILNRKSNVSRKGVPFKTIIWNYLCWVLAGKPEGWKIKCRG